MACPALAPVALQWEAFLLYMTGDHAGSRRLDLPAPKALGSGREAVIARARAGDFRDLLKHIDDQEPGYTTTADAQLALARVLTRKGSFTRGRDAYVSYRRLMPDDDDGELEYLYSFIWEGRLAEAEGQLAGASRWTERPEFTQALQRAKALVARLRANGSGGGGAGAGGTADALVPGIFRAGYGQYTTTQTYRRRTAEVGYLGRFDVRLAGHAIDNLALNAPSTRSSELWGGGGLAFAGIWHASAHGGFFSTGSDHWFGDLSGGATLANGLGADVGGYRTPLALIMPLTPDVGALMRDAAFTTLKWKQYVEVHGELQQELDEAAHEHHTALGRVPLKRVEVPGDDLYLRIPLSYEVNPRPSPNYDSDPKVIQAGAGVEMARPFANRWSLDLVADYDMAFITDRDNTEHTRHDGIIAVSADIMVPIDESFKVELTGRYYRADEDRDLQTQHLVNAVVLSLAYGDLDKRL
jgi:hypothetical protein